MKTPLQRRAERKSRDQDMVDMNLVSLIDVFTILIFFLLFNTGVDLLPPAAVKLPASMADKAPRETLVVIVTGAEVIVDGRSVAKVSDVMATSDDLIEGLKAALDAQAGKLAAGAADAAGAAASAGKTVTIMGDKDIPYQLLRKVMFTAARADFADVSFAVRTVEL